MTPRKLNRRAVLRGVGTIIGLPFLDAMVPAFGSPAREGSKQPLRLAVAYVPNGIIMDQWTPGEAPGATPERPTQKPLGKEVLPSGCRASWSRWRRSTTIWWSSAA